MDTKKLITKSEGLIRPVVLFFAIFQIFVLGFFVGYIIKAEQANVLSKRFLTAYSNVVKGQNDKDATKSTVTPTPTVSIPNSLVSSRFEDMDASQIESVRVLPSSKLKEYRAEKEKFSFQYPENFYLTTGTYVKSSYIAVSDSVCTLIFQPFIEGTSSLGEPKGTETNIGSILDNSLVRATAENIPGVSFYYASKVANDATLSGITNLNGSKYSITLDSGCLSNKNAETFDVVVKTLKKI